jgi:hypothetical protein
LAYREKEPAQPRLPRTARQNLACHADGRKKTAVAAVVRLFIQDANPVSRFFRDVLSFPKTAARVNLFLQVIKDFYNME